MNRRAFLKSVAAFGAAATLAPSVLIPTWKRNEPQILRYRGVPFVFDQYAAKNTIYFVAPQTLRILKLK
jgi:hypothetical protein